MEGHDDVVIATDAYAGGLGAPGQLSRPASGGSLGMHGSSQAAPGAIICYCVHSACLVAPYSWDHTVRYVI